MIDGGALRGLMSRSIEVLQPEKVIRNYVVGHQIGTAGHLMAAIGPGMCVGVAELVVVQPHLDVCVICGSVVDDGYQWLLQVVVCWLRNDWSQML